MHGESASPVFFLTTRVFFSPIESDNIIVKIKNKGLEIMIHETTKDTCSIL